MGSGRTGTRVRYEWDMEESDRHGDVSDHHHSDKLKPLLSQYAGNPPREGFTNVLVLVKDEFDEFGDLGDRTWAYVTQGFLPDYFQNGMPVPQRFHKELQRA